MIDAAELASATLSLLTPFAQGSAGKEVAKAVGEEGLKKAEALFSWLKHKFANNPVPATDISRFERNPTQFGPGLVKAIRILNAFGLLGARSHFRPRARRVLLLARPVLVRVSLRGLTSSSPRVSSAYLGRRPLISHRLGF
jgi:hypothetical protein